MRSFFDPVVKQITELLESQIEQVLEQGRDLSRIILVGGFGSSPYLYKKLDAWLAKHYEDMKLSCPVDCQSAVARGAAIRGLEGLVPTSRKARLWYGVSCGVPFRPNIDAEWRAYTDEWSGKRFCRGRMKWLVRKVPHAFPFLLTELWQAGLWQTRILAGRTLAD